MRGSSAGGENLRLSEGTVENGTHIRRAYQRDLHPIQKKRMERFRLRISPWQHENPEAEWSCGIKELLRQWLCSGRYGSPLTRSLPCTQYVYEAEVVGPRSLRLYSAGTTFGQCRETPDTMRLRMCGYYCITLTLLEFPRPLSMIWTAELIICISVPSSSTTALASRG